MLTDTGQPGARSGPPPPRVSNSGRNEQGSAAVKSGMEVLMRYLKIVVLVLVATLGAQGCVVVAPGPGWHPTTAG